MSPTRSIRVLECTCLRCGKVWITRDAVKPSKCSGCKSRQWDTPRTRKPGAGGLAGGPAGRKEQP